MTPRISHSPSRTSNRGEFENTNTVNTNLMRRAIDDWIDSSVYDTIDGVVRRCISIKSPHESGQGMLSL